MFQKEARGGRCVPPVMHRLLHARFMFPDQPTWQLCSPVLEQAARASSKTTLTVVMATHMQLAQEMRTGGHSFQLRGQLGEMGGWQELSVHCRTLWKP